MAVGRYVTIKGHRQRFFGMITDVSLGATDERITQMPPDLSDPFVAEVLGGTSTYGILHVQPYLSLGTYITTVGTRARQNRAGHFSPVDLASERDMELSSAKKMKTSSSATRWIWKPSSASTWREFVKRSNGIFGKSGTGKTFLTRILLIGMLQKSKAVNLIFDMHNEYGWEGTAKGDGAQGQRPEATVPDQEWPFLRWTKKTPLRASRHRLRVEDRL